MLLIVCLDDNGGMMFGARRQSKDRVLRERMLAQTAGKALWMSPYSAAQFEQGAAITADAAYIDKVKAGDACFVEDGAFPAEKPAAILIYRWNRRYPADKYFPFDPLQNGYRLVSSVDFVGSSHDRITADRYEKEG